MLSVQPASLDNAAECSPRFGVPTKAHIDTPSPCAALPGMRVCQPSSMPSSKDLAFKVYPKALQRDAILSRWVWILQDLQPNGNIVVVRSSLLEDLRRRQMGATWKIIRAKAAFIMEFVFWQGILLGLVLACLHEIWENIWGGKKREVCPRWWGNVFLVGLGESTEGWGNQNSSVRDAVY